MSKPDENGILVQEVRVYRKVDHTSANGWDYLTIVTEPGASLDTFYDIADWQLHKRHLVRIPVTRPILVAPRGASERVPVREAVRPAIEPPCGGLTGSALDDYLSPI